jgi:hypothetical protein
MTSVDGLTLCPRYKPLVDRGCCQCGRRIGEASIVQSLKTRPFLVLHNVHIAFAQRKGMFDLCLALCITISTYIRQEVGTLWYLWWKRTGSLQGHFYGRPYHLIPLLEKDQYERIRRLRLIVYHHNLHLWYRVIYIGGIGWYRGIIGSFYLCSINEIYDFFISNFINSL